MARTEANAVAFTQEAVTSRSCWLLKYQIASSSVWDRYDSSKCKKTTVADLILAPMNFPTCCTQYVLGGTDDNAQASLVLAEDLTERNGPSHSLKAPELDDSRHGSK